MILQWIHSTGTGPAMAQLYNYQGGIDENFLHYVLEQLIEQPDNSFNHLSRFDDATEAIMRFSAVLPIGGSAIASSIEPIPCTNSNSNDITNITNIPSCENMGLVDGGAMVVGATSLGGWEWCQ